MLSWPGLGMREKNPYTWLLCRQLAELGVEVRDFTPERALRGGYDILHVHWPEKALNADWVGTRWAGAVAALALIDAARAHGARIVWTAHNAHPHESQHPRLERWYWSAVIRRVDAVIHPSEAGRQSVLTHFPALSRLPQAVVPLGHFRGTYPDSMSREDARASLEIPPGARVVAFLGLVRPDKNVPHLIRTVRALPASAAEVVLLVAGSPHTPALAEEVRQAAASDPRIRLELRHVPNADIQRYLRAADLVALPFRDITNSASALLALSFDRPVLVPSRGAMGELQAIAGADWVCTYDGELTPETLAHALAWAACRAEGRARLDALDWPEIARQTLALYQAARR